MECLIITNDLHAYIYISIIMTCLCIKIKNFEYINHKK